MSLRGFFMIKRTRHCYERAEREFRRDTPPGVSVRTARYSGHLGRGVPTSVSFVDRGDRRGCLWCNPVDFAGTTNGRLRSISGIATSGCALLAMTCSLFVPVLFACLRRGGRKPTALQVYRRDTPPGVSGPHHQKKDRVRFSVAIRIPCGAKHRPVPGGPERERIATSLRSSQ